MFRAAQFRVGRQPDRCAGGLGDVVAGDLAALVIGLGFPVLLTPAKAQSGQRGFFLDLADGGLQR